MLVGLLGANIQGSIAPALFADSFAASGIDGYCHLLDADRLPGRSLPQLLVATHQTGRDFGPTVLTYYMPLLDDDPSVARRRLLATRWEDWVEAILADLSRAHPGLSAIVDNVDIYLWGHAMVRPRPGFMWSDARAASAQPLGRLRFAHTDLSGMALFEEAQHWGLRAAEAVLRAEGRAVPPELG